MGQARQPPHPPPTCRDLLDSATLAVNVPAFLASEAEQQGVVQPSRYLFLSLQPSGAGIPEQGPEGQAAEEGQGQGQGLPLLQVQPLACSYTSHEYGIPGLQLARLLGRGQYGAVYLGSWRGEKVGGGSALHVLGSAAAGGVGACGVLGNKLVVVGARGMSDNK
jgi:hypothetical protein